MHNCRTRANVSVEARGFGEQSLFQPAGFAFLASTLALRLEQGAEGGFGSESAASHATPQPILDQRFSCEGVQTKIVHRQTSLATS